MFGDLVGGHPCRAGHDQQCRQPAQLWPDLKLHVGVIDDANGSQNIQLHVRPFRSPRLTSFVPPMCVSP